MMAQAVLDSHTPPRSVQPPEDEDLLDTRQPAFPYPYVEDLIRTYFTSYLDVDCLVTEKKTEWREVIDRERTLIKDDLATISGLTDERARWFWTEVLKILPPARRIREAQGHIARLERAKSAARRVFDVREPASPAAAFEEMLTRARQVPILDVVSGLIEVRKRGRSHIALCPFHDDKNPSLHIYPKTNTFHCFGCHKGGDAITFVRLHFGYGFKQAVEYLIGGVEDERKSIRGGVRRRERGSHARG